MKGKVSLTCDAWQASNIDGYFAVTGSWIEEVNSQWDLRTALLGFTQLNNAHNGARLGQALFKIVERAGIAHKVRHMITLQEEHNSCCYRLVMSLATMHRTMVLCCWNFPSISMRRKGCLIQYQIASGKFSSIYFFIFSMLNIFAIGV